MKEYLQPGEKVELTLKSKARKIAAAQTAPRSVDPTGKDDNFDAYIKPLKTAASTVVHGGLEVAPDDVGEIVVEIVLANGRSEDILVRKTDDPRELAQVVFQYRTLQCTVLCCTVL